MSSAEGLGPGDTAGVVEWALCLGRVYSKIK